MVKPSEPLAFKSDQQRLNYYKRRWTSAKATADLWIALLNRCYQYTVPDRNLFYWTSQTQGQQKNAKIYDTTSVAATRAFVSKVQNALMPPQQRWALLTAGEDIPEDQEQEINERLQDITDKLFQYIHHSNFDLAVNEGLYDLAIGTMALCINEGKSDECPFEVYSSPLARVAIAESHNAEADTVFRWWDMMRISDIMERWPNARITPEMEANYLADPNAVVKGMVESTIYFPERDTYSYDEDGRRIPVTPYTYCLWYQEEILLEEETESTPWIIFRWTKINNEMYGRGPVIDALPSILSLNEIARLELASANMNVFPPYMAFSDSVFNPWTFQLQPATVIPIAPTSNGQFPISPLPVGSHPEFAQMTMADLRNQINILMYNQPLGPVDAPSKTATEMALRQRNLAEEIGPVMTRLQVSLAQVIKRVLYILRKRGLIDAFEINGKEVDLIYTSPLTFAQGQQDVQTVQSAVQVLQGILGPENTIAFLNSASLAPWVAEKLGADLSVFNTKEEMTKALNNANQQAQQMAQQQMMQAQQGGQ